MALAAVLRTVLTALRTVLTALGTVLTALRTVLTALGTVLAALRAVLTALRAVLATLRTVLATLRAALAIVLQSVADGSLAGVTDVVRVGSQAVEHCGWSFCARVRAHCLHVVLACLPEPSATVAMAALWRTRLVLRWGWGGGCDSQKACQSDAHNTS